MNDKEFLQWIYYRLAEVHSENKNYDYMHRLKEIIDTTEVVKKSNDIQNVSKSFTPKQIVELLKEEETLDDAISFFTHQSNVC